MNTKHCIGCGNNFPKTTDYFFVKVTKQKRADGEIKTYYSLRQYCKSCHAKNTTIRSRKKRCLELNCTLDELDEKVKEKMSFDKLKYKELVDVPKSKRSYIRLKINRGYVFTTLSQYYIDVHKNIINGSLKHRKYDYGDVPKVTRQMCNKAQIERMTDGRIALILKMKVKDVPKEIIESKRLIISIKRELNKLKIKNDGQN